MHDSGRTINFTSCILHRVSCIPIALIRVNLYLIRLALKMVGVTGFEPVTPGPPCRCATNCATPRFLDLKGGGISLNLET